MAEDYSWLFADREREKTAPLPWEVPVENSSSSEAPPPPAIIELARTAVAAEKQKEAPPPPMARPKVRAVSPIEMAPPPPPPDPGVRKNYSQQYRDLVSNPWADEGEREKLRTQKFSAQEALPYILNNLFGNRKKSTIEAIDEAREKKRSGDVEAFDQARKKRVEDYMASKKFGKIEGEDDPTSIASRIAQEYMKALDPKQDWSDRSATDLKEFMGPYLEKYKADATAALAERRLEATENYRTTARTEKKDTATVKRKDAAIKEVNSTIDTLSGLKRMGTQGPFVMSNKRVILANDGLRMIDQVKSGYVKGDATVEAELATMLASLMTGGNAPAMQTIEHFMSKTSLKTAANVAKYLTAKPQDALSKPMIKQLEHQILGQKKYWSEVRNQVTAGQYVKLEHIFAEFPEEKLRFDRAIHDLNLGSGSGAQPTDGVGSMKIGKDGLAYLMIKHPKTGRLGWAPVKGSGGR